MVIIIVVIIVIVIMIVAIIAIAIAIAIAIVIVIDMLMFHGACVQVACSPVRKNQIGINSQACSSSSFSSSSCKTRNPCATVAKVLRVSQSMPPHPVENLLFILLYQYKSEDIPSLREFCILKCGAFR